MWPCTASGMALPRYCHASCCQCRPMSLLLIVFIGSQGDCQVFQDICEEDLYGENGGGRGREGVWRIVSFLLLI